MQERATSAIGRSFSLILPCYNLGGSIYSNIQIVRNYLEKHFDFFEIIVVNDGSTDNTREELLRAKQDLGIYLISYSENKGKGYAVRQGVSRARHDIIGFLDADLAIPVYELERFVESIVQGNDLVIASRLRPGGRVVIPVLQHRRFMERVFRYLRVAIIGGAQVKDTQCGCKVFASKVKENIFPYMRVNRFAFDAELIFLALQKKYHIKEISITLQNPRVSSIRLIRDSLTMLRDLFRIRWAYLQNLYREVTLEKVLEHPSSQLAFDDFGITKEVNARILELAEALPHSRVAVMMNGQFSEEDKARLACSQVSIDVHLDRHTKAWVSPDKSVWIRIGAFLKEALYEKDTIAIEQVWIEQIEEFRNRFGRLPQALNTHEHVHFFPQYFQALLRVAKKFEINEIRFAHSGTKNHGVVAWVLNVLRWWNRRVFQKSGYQTSKYLLSWDWFYTSRNPQAQIERYLQEGTTEIVFHVAHEKEYWLLKKTIAKIKANQKEK